MLLCIFGCKHRTQGESLTRVGVVCDVDAVGFAIVYYRVDARNLVAAYALDGKLVGSHVVGALHRAVGKVLLALNP